jgi:hypothetical protein
MILYEYTHHKSAYKFHSFWFAPTLKIISGRRSEEGWVTTIKVMKVA